jgi:hypothetical protein
MAQPIFPARLKLRGDIRSSDRNLDAAPGRTASSVRLGRCRIRVPLVCGSIRPKASGPGLWEHEKEMRRGTTSSRPEAPVFVGCGVRLRRIRSCLVYRQTPRLRQLQRETTSRLRPPLRWR